MACNEQPIRIFKGTARTFRVLIRDATSGDPLDLTTLGEGDDITMTVSPEEGEAATFTKNLADGVTVVTPHTGDNIGKADILITADDTGTQDVLFQRYDVVLTLSGEKYVVVEPSDFEIVPMVTLPS